LNITEVDFVISTEHLIFPLEVKAGFSKKKKSLTVDDEKFSKEKVVILGWIC
jgi:predicted AAA+ superfamily ATPase